MQAEKLLKKLKLTSENLSSIKTAVAEAEKTTTGEIALAAVPQSDSYSFVEFFAAMCLAFLSFFVMLLFADKIWGFLEKALWYPSPRHLAAYIGLIVLSITVLFFLLINIPIFDRIIIPNRIKEKRVYARAIRHFVECGIYNTAERTGILIFVSVLERKVFVIADSGIAEKVGQDEWKEICKIITDGLKSGKAAQAFCKAAAQCGAILSHYFPNRDENPNEYPNGLVILEE